MLFNSFQFAIFFAVVFGALRIVPRRLEGGVLLASSLVFYALSGLSLLPVLIGLLGANYALLRLSLAWPHPKRYVAASVLLTLGVLCFYKYGPLVVRLLGEAIPSVRGPESFFASLVVPLGISFYGFECISLVVDARRGLIPRPGFARYLLFVTFFPHLLAGPIMRGADLLPQLEAGGRRNAARTRRGFWLFTVGLVKKTVLSDYLLVPFVSDTFGAPGAHTGPVHLVAMYGFAFQIYFDFSGYSDMARGLACVLGYELPLNFGEPYLARDPSEFWQRWHMTLSRWLRDYLYVPLGGNRLGRVRTHLNLMITMLLGGLWHGAGLNFVVWGGLHGLLLVAHRNATTQRASAERPLRWTDLPSVVVLFHLVCLTWIPFRAATWADSIAFVRGLVSGGYLHGWPIVPLGTVALCAALHGFERYVRLRLPLIHEAMARAWWGPAVEGALFGGALVASVLASGGGVQFIYFQF